MWILSDCDAYMSKCNWSVLLSGSIHVFMHCLSWIYSHPLVVGWAPDDMMSLRFLCKYYHILEFTRQLKQQEKQENWRKRKRQNRGTFGKKRHTIWQGIMHCFDIKENVSRWQKRDTIWSNPNSVSCYTRWKRVPIYLKRDTILGEFLCLFKLKTIQKTRVTIWEEQSAILRPKDG